MKRIVVLLATALLLALPVLANAANAQPAKSGKDAGAAALLSAVFAGSGEWYNSDFKGDFPWGECCLGEICCLVKVSSIFDAAAGKSESGDIRLDFWTAPKK